MVKILLFFIGATLGSFISFIFMCVLTASSNSDDLQEAYERGFKDGENAALENVNNLYNKYKDMTDEHTDIRC